MSRIKLKLLGNGAWLTRLSSCSLVLVVSFALFTILWAGVVKADPPSPVKVDYSFYAGYDVPTWRATTAADLAAAMDIPSQDLISAEVLSGNLTSAFAIFGRIPGTWFPTRNDTFLWMSTGDAFATSFATPTAMSLASFNTTGAAEVRLVLHVPDDMTCANFDFAFYTREPRPTTSSSPNDFFVAQLNTHALLTPTLASGLPISAPTNFALGLNNEMVTVQSVYAAPAVAYPPPTDGAVSPLLRARAQVSSGHEVEIYLTLRAAGDGFQPSAVALDNFHWSKDDDCITGQAGDGDGDGLPDGWELYGISILVSSSSGPYTDFVNLPLIGAKPDHKDIFVEIDHMELMRPVNSEVLFDYTPNQAAIQTVVDAFNSAPITNLDGISGIHLHVDFGKSIPLQWPGDTTQAWTWDSFDGTHMANLGDGGAIPFAQYVLFCPDEVTEDWNDVDQIKRANLKKAHALVFHYNIWGHQLCKHKPGTSGISRNYQNEQGEFDYFTWGASDFIVTLGDKTFQLTTEPTRTNQEAGTFMHELGHNLGLQHGGGDSVNYKPNHLSVMNGLFQLDGLIVDGKRSHFDYMSFDPFPLTITHLLESRGIYQLNQQSSTHFGTSYYCPTIQNITTTNAAWQAIDWDCDGTINSAQAVSTTIVKVCKSCVSAPLTSTQVLTSINEWQHIAFTGGLLRRDLNFLAPAPIMVIFSMPGAGSAPRNVPTSLPDQLEERIPATTNFDEVTADDR